VHALGSPRLVADINVDGQGSYPDELTAVDDTLFFVADDGIHGRELWASVGGAEPTMLADLNLNGDSDPHELFGGADGRLYFSANDGAIGHEPYVSDGTAAGTYLLGDLDPGWVPSEPAEFTQYGGEVYFRAGGDSSGYELWRTDGTPSGTVVAADLDPTGSSYPSNLTVVGHGGVMRAERPASRS